MIISFAIVVMVASVAASELLAINLVVDCLMPIAVTD